MLLIRPTGISKSYLACVVGNLAAPLVYNASPNSSFSSLTTSSFPPYWTVTPPYWTVTQRLLEVIEYRHAQSLHPHHPVSTRLNYTTRRTTYKVILSTTHVMLT